MCAGHYHKWRKARTDVASCSRDGCGRAVAARGLCDPHYQAWRRDPDGSARIATPMEKFFKRVDKTSSCWLWTGRVDEWGYGRHSSTHGPQTVLAYKWLWESLNGPVPSGRQLDHLCRTPACVRPDHLEPVTPRVNNLRSDNVSGVNARKTHCLRGHEFTAENTYWRRSGGRDCRACIRERRSIAHKKWSEPSHQ